VCRPAKGPTARMLALELVRLLDRTDLRLGKPKVSRFFPSRSWLRQPSNELLDTLVRNSQQSGSVTNAQAHSFREETHRGAERFLCLFLLALSLFPSSSCHDHSISNFARQLLDEFRILGVLDCGRERLTNPLPHLFDRATSS